MVLVIFSSWAPCVVIIPLVTIPLSLIGVLFLSPGDGVSLNLLTLLAMVIAIGLVVDDAIVVVENVPAISSREPAPWTPRWRAPRGRLAGSGNDHHPRRGLCAHRLHRRLTGRCSASLP